MAKTEIYDIDTDTYIDGPDMDTARDAPCTVVAQKAALIYIIGGHNGTGFYTGTQVFDTTQRIFLPPLASQLAVGRMKCAGTISEEDGMLVVAGGTSTGWAKIDSVEVLNLKTETWSTVGPMPSPGGVWTANQILFLWNGKFFQYVPITDLWLEVKDPTVPMGQMRENFQPIPVGVGKLCQYI